MSDSSRILVLGGTSFIGRTFCELLRDRHGQHFTLLNRGRTNPGLFAQNPVLICDRNDSAECKAKLESTHWDAIVDFTAYDDAHIRNVLGYCKCDHYTLISSSAVDLSWPADPLFSMAQNKLWCEHLVQRFVKKTLFVRPGFVCGTHDYTQRFEEIDGQWFWRGTSNLVYPMVRADFLANLLIYFVRERKTGIVRAGYNV
jgi:nucleoside-diphosphate-sugar epimerase